MFQAQKYSSQIKYFFNNNVIINYLIQNNNKIGNHLLVVIAFFLPITQGTVNGMYAFLLFLLIFRENKKEMLLSVFNNKVIRLFLLFVLMHYVWILFSSDMLYSYHYAKLSWRLLHVVLVFLFLDYKYVYRVISAFLLGVFISELFSYGLAFGLIDGPFIFSHPFASFNDPSPFMDHLAYGFTLSFSIVLLFQIILRESNLFIKISAIIFALSMSTNLLLNAGRTGYILYLIALPLFFYLKCKESFYKIFILLVIGFSILFSIGYNTSNIFKSRVNYSVKSVNQIIDNKDYRSSIGLRLEINKFAIPLIMEKPLVGYGTGQHISTFYNRAKKEGAWFAEGRKKASNLDSQYIDILLQFGFVGLILLLNIFYQTLRYDQADKDLKIVQIVLVSLFFFDSFQAPTLLITEVSQIFIFFIALTLIKKSDTTIKLPLKFSIKTLVLYLSIGIYSFAITHMHSSELFSAITSGKPIDIERLIKK
jgi:O-antigen ligase